MAFSVFFSWERPDSDKAWPELHIYYKPLLTRVYDYTRCKEYCKDFTVALKILDAFLRNKFTSV